MVALPAYYGGNALNFEPVTNALAQVTQQNNANRQYGLEQQQSARADQSLALQKRSTESALKTQALQYENLTHTILASTAQGALSVQDPNARAAIANGIVNGHPEMANKLQQYGIDPKNPDGVLNFFANYGQSPLEIQSKKATIGLTGAETAKARAEADLARAQVSGISNPDEALFGPPSGAAPQGSFGVAPTQTSPMGGPSPSPQMGISPAPAMAPGVTPNGLPTAPPAGSLTAANGAVMPSSQRNPSYFSPEDRSIYRTALLNPRAAAALEKTPGFQQRLAQSQAVGKNLGNLEERQRAGGELLKNLDDLKGYIGNADDDTIANAMGPAAYAKVTPSAIAPLSYQAWTAPKPENYEDLPTRVKAEATYNGTTSAKKYWDFQNGLDHLVNGLTEQFVAGAAKGGVQMSDSRQKIFDETMGALRQSTSKKEALSIYEKARKIISRSFDLPDDYQSAPTQSASSSLPPQAIADLKANPTPQMRAHFDEAFGPGASVKALGAP